ncbi:UDP-glucuronic acid decarboxylase family protein [Priestia sp. FSL W8-0001]|uniref:UDP-glucuronic acid decarboxylase family protein n=1 Tax=unclassified Priestia TaxID=2800374 RepID=UPI0030FA3A26
MSRKIIITGVAGFLGSHLLTELLKEGNSVIGIDNMSTGKQENIEQHMNNKCFTFLCEDVSNPQIVNKAIFEKIDEIYHMASPASPVFYQENPFDTIYVNTIGTKNMLSIAKKNNAKLLFTSTSEVYGDPEIHPQPESYRGNVNTWGPRACYDEAKRLGEVMCYEYFNRFKVDVKVVRIFNTYSAGLRNDDGRVISNFVTQAIKGEDLTVYGDGSQTRSFCYVDDNIRALKLVMASNNTSGEIINVGNPCEYSILEVAHLVKALTNSNSEITFHPLPQDDPKVRRPIINRAKELINWEPKVDIKEGLSRTIEVYKEKLNQKITN